MPQRPLEQVWRLILTAVALLSLGMALYFQLFERRLQGEQDRLAALRQEEELAASQAGLSTELATQGSERPAEEGSTDSVGDQPLPNAVLRRGESGTSSALQQFVGPPDTQQLIARLQEQLDAMSSRTEESDRALRRDLEAWRAQVRRELDTSNKILTLLLVALIALVAHLLFSLWQPRRWRGDEESTEREKANRAWLL
jgi:hypothetical protein